MKKVFVFLMFNLLCASLVHAEGRDRDLYRLTSCKSNYVDGKRYVVTVIRDRTMGPVNLATVAAQETSDRFNGIKHLVSLPVLVDGPRLVDGQSVTLYKGKNFKLRITNSTVYRSKLYLKLQRDELDLILLCRMYTAPE